MIISNSKYLLLVVLYLMIPTAILAQNSEFNYKIDSLNKLISENTVDDDKSALYFEIGKIFMAENVPDSALHYYKFSYQTLSDSLGSKSEKITNELGLFYYRQSNFTVALSYFQKALQIALRNNDSVSIAHRYSNIGVIYDYLGDYVKSFEYNQEALKIFEQQNSKRGMAFIYNNLGVLSEEMDNPKNALDYHRKALQLKIEIDDKSGVGSSLNNIGVVFEQYLPNYDSSIFYYRMAYHVFDEVGNKSGIATSLGNIGVVHWLNHQPDSAIFYAEKALEIRNSIHDEEGISSTLLNLGKSYFDLKDYRKAESFFQQSLKISKKTNSRKRTSEIYEALAKLYNKQQKNDKAYDFHLQYSQLRDSLLNEENNKQIAELKTRYELEKKDKQLEILSQKNYSQKQSIKGYNYLLASILIIAFLITFITVLLVRHNRLKVQQQTTELRQKLLRSQMNPHFIFNTLFSIQTYMLENDAISASRFLSKFAKLMRNILENSKHEFVNLESEIEFLNDYLFIQQLRYDESFTYEVIFEGKEEPVQLQVPPMLSQPFVENAIDHGIRNIKRKGKVAVTFTSSRENIQVTISDNGVGYYKHAAGNHANKNHHSTGVDNTRQRIQLFNNEYKTKSLFKIQDLSFETPPKQGTIITFAIPKIYA